MITVSRAYIAIGFGEEDIPTKRLFTNKNQLLRKRNQVISNFWGKGVPRYFRLAVFKFIANEQNFHTVRLVDTCPFLTFSVFAVFTIS